jgi:hypothetical protein
VLEAERLEQPRLDVLPVRDPGDALDEDPEQREREIRVVEPRAGRQHAFGAIERVEQLVDVGEAPVEPRVVVRLALQAGRVREQAANRRCALRPLDVLVERVFEIERAFITQLHHCGSGERLRDRSEPVLRVRRRVAVGIDVGCADGRLPRGLSRADDGDRDAREALVALLCADELLELGGERVRRGHRAPPG